MSKKKKYQSLKIFYKVQFLVSKQIILTCNILLVICTELLERISSKIIVQRKTSRMVFKIAIALLKLKMLCVLLFRVILYTKTNIDIRSCLTAQILQRSRFFNFTLTTFSISKILKIIYSSRYFS